MAAASMTAMLAGSPEPAAQRPADLPTVTISVHSAPAISPVIIDRTLEEASAIWRPTGVTFKWQKAEAVRAEVTPPRPTRPRVLIDDSRGTPRGAGSPMGWVNFVDDEPDGDIHISHANAERLRHDGAERKLRYVSAANSMQPSCMRDEGRPLGLGLQGQGPNHRERRRSHDCGRERLGKGGM